MADTPVLKPREVVAILERLGFVEVRQRGSHKQFRHLDGRSKSQTNGPDRVARQGGPEGDPSLRLLDKMPSGRHAFFVTPAEALTEIRGYASANRILIVPHAYTRMAERGAHYSDVRHALMTARACRAQENERWRLEGTDLDGDELTVIAAIRDGVVVVTVF